MECWQTTRLTRFTKAPSPTMKHIIALLCLIPWVLQAAQIPQTTPYSRSLLLATNAADGRAILEVTGSGTTEDSTEDWTLVIVPDTQYLTAGTLDSMGDWIVANRTALNIKAVVGLGDVTDDGSVDAQWNNSTNLYYQSKAASIPTIVAIGNHDYDSGGGNVPSGRAADELNERYGPSWFTSQTSITSTTYYQSGHSENAAHFLNLGGDPWLILVIEFGPRDAVLTWANAILDANPNKRTIVITHAYLLPDGTRDGQTHQDTYNPHSYAGIASDCNDGQEIWLASIRDRQQVELVMNGHYLTPGAGPGRQASIGTAGNVVHELYSNYQDYGSTAGRLRVMGFQNSNTRVDVKTYATDTAGYLTGDRDRFSLDLKKPLPATTLERRAGVGLISPAENGLEDGLVFWAPFAEVGGSNTMDVVSGTLGTFRGTNYPTRGSEGGSLGRFLKMNDSGSVVFPWNWRFNGMTGLTVSAWVRMTNDADGGIFASIQGGGTSGQFYLASLTNNAIRLTIIDDNPTREDYDVPVSGLYDGSWHNVLATWGNSEVNVYKDGVLLTNIAGLSGTMQTYTSASIALGDYSGNAGTWDTNYIMGGDLDEVRIWNRALSSFEVQRVAQVVEWARITGMPAGFADGVDDEGVGGSDATAIHDDTAGEIAAIADKASAAAGDHLLIEDSADSNNKKDLLVSGLESALESLMDLQDMQGAVTDAQVPDSITVTTAGTANAGDSATAFFTTGQIERARGGTGVDSSGFGTGLLGSTDGTTITDVDTEAELETALGGINLLKSGDNIGAATATDEAYNSTTWDGSLQVPTKNAIRDKIESMGSGGAALAGTVIGSGTPTTYAIPRYSNTSGTNIEPSTVLVDGGAITGVKSMTWGQSIPNTVSLGTVSGGGTATLTGTNSHYTVTFSGSTATVALPGSPPDGTWYLHGTTTYGSGSQIITIPSLIRPEMDFDTAITTITNSASSSGKFTYAFTAIGGSFVKVSAVGDAYAPAGGVGGSTSDDEITTAWNGGTTSSPSQNAVYDELARNWLSVRWYGALGDGTDETTEIKNAYNAITKTLGGTLYFPPGKYKFNLQVTNKNIRILGSGGFRDEAGSVTNYFAAADATLPVIQVGDGTNAAHGWKIENCTFYGLTGANPDDVGVRLAGGAQEGGMHQCVVWRFDTNIWVEATGTLPTEINVFEDVVIRMASGINDSRGYYIRMPDANSGSFYTTSTLLRGGRVICGQVNNTNFWGMEVADTDVTSFGTYWDSYQYGRCLLTTSPSGSSGAPTFAGYKVRFDDAGGAASNPIVWVSNKSSAAGIMEVLTGRIMFTDGFLYGDGTAGEVSLGDGTFNMEGYYNKMLYPEVQDTMVFTLMNDAGYAGMNWSHTLGRLTTNMVLATTGDLLLHSTNGGVKFTGVMTGGTVYDEKWIPASAMLPTATSGPSLRTNSWATTTDGQQLEVLDFDGSTDESAQFTLTLPDSWDGGTVKAKVVWKAVSATSGTAVWSVAGGSYTDAETAGNTLGTAVNVNDAAQSTTNTVAVSSATSAITIGGSPSAGHQVWFRVYRLPTNGSDDIASDVSLIGVQLQYSKAIGSTAW